MNKKIYHIIIFFSLLLMLPSVAQANNINSRFMNMPDMNSLNPKHHNRYHNIDLPWATQEMTFNKDWPTLLVIGDSITYGWYDKGSNVSFPYGYYAAKNAKLNYSNISYPGARIVSNPTLPISIHKQLSEHQDLVKKASVITIMIGVNDYLHSSDINYTKRELTRLINDIKALNSKAKIIGILPLMPYIYQPALIPKIVCKDRVGNTFFDYYLAEEEVYRMQKIPFISLYELGFKDDGIYCGDGLHPTPIQHHDLGKALGKYLTLCRSQLSVIPREQPLEQQQTSQQSSTHQQNMHQVPSTGQTAPNQGTIFSPPAYIQTPIY